MPRRDGAASHTLLFKGNSPNADRMRDGQKRDGVSRDVV